MIYTISHRIYSSESRRPGQTAVTVLSCKRLRLRAGEMSGEDKVGRGNILSLCKFSSGRLTAEVDSELTEIAYEYSDSMVLFDLPLRIIRATQELQAYMHRIYLNSFYSGCLPGVNEGLLVNILNMLNLLCGSNTGEINLYQSFCVWLEENMPSCITAEQAANAMDCTVAHLNRIVKKQSGKCLSTVLNERRILAIRQLLQRDGCSTREIAARLGFETPELLRKFYKYHTGTSLSQYREMAML